MQRLLFITDTYYPDSSATTTQVRRTAEALVERGYAVDVYPSEISGNHFNYTAEYNGVRIISPDTIAREERFVPVKASEDHPFTSKQVEDLTRVLVSINSVFSSRTFVLS